MALHAGRTPADLEASARDITISSGFDDTLALLTLTAPPVTGAHAGDPGAVEVVLDRSRQHHFSGLFIAEPYTGVVAPAVTGTCLSSNVGKTMKPPRSRRSRTIPRA